MVGSVILKGKKPYWGRPNTHYHQGMQPGDNTLNLLCVRVLIRAMNAAGRYDPADFLRDYVAFMTAPDRHNDTYAESYHRDFFANYARGLPPERCAGAEGHDTASIGGLVALPPVIFAMLGKNDRAAVDTALLTQLRLTHRSQKLERYALALGELLVRLFQDSAAQLRPLACGLAERLGFPAAAVIEQVERGHRFRPCGDRWAAESRLLHRSVFPGGPVSGGALSRRPGGGPDRQYERRRRQLPSRRGAGGAAGRSAGFRGDSQTLD